MPDFKKINAAMEATLRAEGCTRTSTAKPTADQTDEFLGRFKIASVDVEGAYYGVTNMAGAWAVHCAGAMALIVGRGMPLPIDRQFALALAGESDPRKMGEVFARYRSRLSLPAAASPSTALVAAMTTGLNQLDHVSAIMRKAVSPY